jgi:GLTT repeat (6 copies)
MRDPELVARAQRAAARLESAWEQWRGLHGLAVKQSQPVVSYVGYSLREPWGEPRVVIGIDADEAEFLADFLDRDECASTGQLPAQQVTSHQVPMQQSMLTEAPQSTEGEYTSQSLLGAPVQLGIVRQAGDPSREMAAELAAWSSGELPGQASEQLAGWPPQGLPSSGLPSPGRSSPGLASPGLASPGLASPGMASPGLAPADQPPGTA